MKEEIVGMLITVLSGVAVYVISQWYTEFVIRPIQEYKNLKAKVAKLLILYAHYYSNPQACESAENYPRWEAAAADLRELASEVAAFAEVKPFHLFVFFAIPTKKQLLNATSNLIGLSNSFFITKHAEERHYHYIEQCRTSVKKNMRINKSK